MTPLFKAWRDEESGIPMIRGYDMEKMTGADEYRADVRGHKFATERLVCKVTLKGYDEPDKTAWADTTTGSLYRMDGQCESGGLRIHGKPVLSGRKVPSRTKRLYEAEQRASVW